MAKGEGVKWPLQRGTHYTGWGKGVMLHQFWREREDNFLTRAHNND